MSQQNPAGSQQPGPLAEDKALVERFRNGDTLASRALYERYAQPVFRFLSALGVPPEEREDAAQDVFIAVYRGLKQFRAPRLSPGPAATHAFVSLASTLA